MGGASATARRPVRVAGLRPGAPTTFGPRIVLVSADEFTGEMLDLALRHRGLSTVGRCTTSQKASALIAQGADVMLRLVTLLDGEDHLSEFSAARRIDASLGLVLLTTARDLRLLGASSSSLPVGTRVLCVREPGGLARLAAVVESAVERPLAPQRRSSRLPLTDEQVDALRAVASGMSNEELAARRSTSVGATRALIVRAARAVGVRTDAGPSRMRAELAAAYVRLVGGADLITPT